MSQAGAAAGRRSKADKAVAERLEEVAENVFRPMLRQQIDRAKTAEERAAVLQTCVEMVALGMPGRDDSPEAFAQQVLNQLGIVPDVQTLEQ